MIFFLPETYILTLKLGEDERTGDALAEKLHEVLIKQDCEDTVELIGSDTCNKNSGQHKGVHAKLEERLKRPLQRIMCLKHGIEIFWHRFFRLIDGEFSGPITLKGKIGKLICNNIFYTQNIVNFRVIKARRSMPKLSAKIIRKMSNNQAYIYRIVQAVMSGSGYFLIDKQLRSASPGKLHGARWITLANRILRLYCSTSEPTDELIRLVEFLVNVYAPAWLSRTQASLMVRSASKDC